MRKKYDKVTPKKCKICKEMFTPIHSMVQIYCSDKCRPKPKSQIEKWLEKKDRKKVYIDRQVP